MISRSCPAIDRPNTYIYRFLRIGFLNDPYCCVCHKNKEDNEGFYESGCSTGCAVRFFYEREDERNQGRCKKNQDKLVLELL